MKSRNQIIYSENKEDLNRLQEEYTLIGFDTKLEEGRLIVFAVPRGSMSRKQKRQAAKRNRSNKRLTRPKRTDSL